MALLVMLVLGVAGWAWYSGRLGADPGRKLAVAAGALIAAWLLLRGQWLTGGLLAAATAGLAWAGVLRRRAGVSTLDVAGARQVLGVPVGASAEEVRAAHRRLIAQVHPDRGGSAELTRQVNEARDRLLQALGEQG